jgi:hypothetical protein
MRLEMERFGGQTPRSQSQSPAGGIAERPHPGYRERMVAARHRVPAPRLAGAVVGMPAGQLAATTTR